jgi:endonuclease/exonuclease/phosphatase family metal-dependent hydrolase
MRGFAVIMPLVLSGTLAPVEPVPSEVRVLSWNVNKGKQLGRLAETISRLNPDVVLLQEVDLHARRTASVNIAEELGRLVRMNYLFGPSYRELSQGTNERPAYLGQAILTRLPVRSSRVLQFQRQSGFWKRSRYLPNWGILQRREGGRVALVAELGSERPELVLYNLHLESRGLGATRLAQLDEALADAQKYGPDVTVLLAGDLNSRYRPGAFQQKLERAGFRNCFAGRVRTHRLAGTLDWLAVRGPGACEEARVVRKTRGSDHDALTAVVALRGAGRRAATGAHD